MQEQNDNLLYTIEENTELQSIIDSQNDEIKRINNRYLKSVHSEVQKQTKALRSKIDFLEQAQNDFEKQSLSSLKILKKATSNSLNVHEVFNSVRNGRLNTLFDTDLYLVKLNINATIGSGDHSYKDVTLTSCSCPDFQHTHLPCKHMIFLMYSLGILQMHRDEFYQKDLWLQEICELQIQKKDLEKKIKSAKRTENALDKKLKALNIAIPKAEAELGDIVKNKCAAYPQFAEMYADIYTYYYQLSAYTLHKKHHPAHTEAFRIKELREHTNEHIKEKKILEYKLGHIYSLYPEIKQIFDDDFDYQNIPPLEQLKK